MPTTTLGAPSHWASVARGVRWKCSQRRRRPWWCSRVGRWLAAAAATLAMLHAGCVLRRAALDVPPACMCSLRRLAFPQVRASACRVRACCARGGASRPQRTGGVCEASWRRQGRTTLRRRARRGRDCGATCSWAPQWWACDYGGGGMRKRHRRRILVVTGSRSQFLREGQLETTHA